jgi:hypothetical protein
MKDKEMGSASQKPEDFEPRQEANDLGGNRDPFVAMGYQLLACITASGGVDLRSPDLLREAADALFDAAGLIHFLRSQSPAESSAGVGAEGDQGTLPPEAINTSSLQARVAELEGALEKYDGAISWLEPPFVTADTDTAEVLMRVKFMLGDVARARSALIGEE